MLVKKNNFSFSHIVPSDMNIHWQKLKGVADMKSCDSNRQDCGTEEYTGKQNSVLIPPCFQKPHNHSILKGH